MTHVLVIERRPATRARALAAGVSAPYATELCEEPDQIDKRLLRRRFAAVVLPLAPGTDPAVVGIIHAVRDRFPRLPVVVWCDEDAPGASILSAARAGAEHFAFDGVDRVNDVLRALVPPASIEHGDASSSVEKMVRDAIALWPPLAQRLFERVVFGTPAVSSVDSLARELQLAKRTLDRRCADRGWPTPNEFVVVGRLTRGIMVLEQTGDLARAAGAAGYRAIQTFQRKVSALSGSVPARGEVLSTTIGALLGNLIEQDLLPALDVRAADGLREVRPVIVHPTIVGPARSTALTATEGGRRQEHRQHRLHATRRAQVERAKTGIAFHEVSKRAG